MPGTAKNSLKEEISIINEENFALGAGKQNRKQKERIRVGQEIEEVKNFKYLGCIKKL